MVKERCRSGRFWFDLLQTHDVCLTGDYVPIERDGTQDYGHGCSTLSGFGGGGGAETPGSGKGSLRGEGWGGGDSSGCGFITETYRNNAPTMRERSGYGTREKQEIYEVMPC